MQCKWHTTPTSRNTALILEVLLDIRDILLKQQQEVDVALDHLVDAVADKASDAAKGGS
jgi:hypothetical protein